MRLAPLRALFILLPLLNGCSDAPPSTSSDAPPWLEDVAEAHGVDYTYLSGHAERFLIPEGVGGGVALFDMDGDDDLDLYFVQSGACIASADDCAPNQLYRNNGDGTFVNVTEGSGADHRGYGMGVACGDYDNDGDVDLYATYLGPNVLLRNDGEGHFTDVSAPAGVDDDAWGASTAFVDYDHDGDLDLYVANYIDWFIDRDLPCYNDRGELDYCGPVSYDAPARDVLYRNNGDGTFTDVSKEALRHEYFGNGLGVICGDFTGDGLVDIFVANDGMRDQLWANQGDGTFHDVGLTWGCGYDNNGQPKAGMGLTAADIDDDGDLDFMVCNLATESDSFFLNANGFFLDSTASVGLAAASRSFTRFGMAWVDLDNDAYLDLYQANGRIARHGKHYSDDPYAEPNLLMQGGPGPWFSAMEPVGGTAELLAHTSRGAAFGDIDNDGAMDIVVVNRDARAYVLRNVAPDRGHWIALRVIDEHGRDAFGATVRMILADRRIARDVRAAYSYFASNDPRVHLGLGEATSVTDVTITWTDGTTESFGDLSADQFTTLKRGEGTAVLE